MSMLLDNAKTKIFVVLDINICLQPAAVFLIRSYGAGRCPVAQCYDKTWATLAQSKIKLGQYCQLVVALLDVGS